MKTILVHMSDRRWTMQAVHLACALARNHHAAVLLLRLIPVRHPAYLGTDLGDAPVSSHEYGDLQQYIATSEDYGVELSLCSMQCLTALDALADAAGDLRADVAFARVPDSRIPYWHRFQVWRLERQLSAAGCRLFTLDESRQDANQALSLTMTPARSAPLSEAHSLQHPS